MTTMKRFSSLIALGAVAVWLGGCGGDTKTNDDTATDGTPDTTEDGSDVTPDTPEDVTPDTEDDTAVEDTVEDVPMDMPVDVPEDTAVDVPVDTAEEEVAVECTVDGDCDDDEDCNGIETCNGAGMCLDGIAEVDGELCDADGSIATRDICLDEVCVLSECGDGFPDYGDDEDCDDGNLIADDGCENDCTYSSVAVTAYRTITLDIMDPHMYTAVGVCLDITDAVNSEFATAISTYELNFVNLFRPLDTSIARNPDEFITTADCTAGTPDSCTRDISMLPVATYANNQMTGSATCLSANASHLNTDYTVPNAPDVPCFDTDARTFNISLGGLEITLTDAQLGAIYDTGSPPDQLITGVIIGFLSVAEAQAAVFPEGTPLIEGDSLYEHLAHGRATGSACETAMGTWDVDDSDMNGSVEGFWFHINFTAELIDWTDP